jgi:hypothetical protein
VKGVVAVLQQAPDLGLAQQAVDGFVDLQAGLADFAADAGQLGTGVVADLAALVDDVADAVGDRAEVADAVGEVLEFGAVAGSSCR